MLEVKDSLSGQEPGRLGERGSGSPHAGTSLGTMTGPGSAGSGSTGSGNAGSGNAGPGSAGLATGSVIGSSLGSTTGPATGGVHGPVTPPADAGVLGDWAAARRQFRDEDPEPAIAAPTPVVPRNSPISLRHIEELLAPSARRLRFPDPLEDEFEIDSAEARTQLARWAVVMAMGLFAVFCVVDYWVLPDVFGISLMSRLIIEPLLACVLFLPLARLPAWVRESILMLDTVIVGGAVTGVIFSSHAELVPYEHSTVLLIPLFAAIAARLRFSYALGASMANLLTYVTFAVIYPHQLPSAAMWALSLTLTGVTLFSLFANYEMELGDRRAYLLRRQGELQRLALQDAHQRLESLSGADELTGIANRRKFEAEFKASWSQALMDGTPLSLLIVDVDFFKLYNDTYGNAQGDACLQAFARVMQQAADRRAGVAARLGGAEYAMVLPRTDVQRACRIAEALCEEVRALGLPHRRSTIASWVTISVGAATITPTRADQSRGVLLSAADRALYRSKSEGRNRATHAALTDTPDEIEL